MALATPIAPENEGALARAIAEAYEAGVPLAIRGNGTKESLGRPVQAAAVLTTRALTGITLHSPSELVVAARAGTPVAEIEASLATKGQHLIAEPPDLSALTGPGEGPQTIGGVIACNLSGPRRIALGAMRDHVLGVRAVNGMGEVIRSGGRVLKNVTGLDLAKLVAGSRGTLAVMSEITLKVLPKPERTATVMLRGLDAARGIAALSAGLGSPFGVTGAAHLPAEAASRAGLGERTATLLRLEDFADFIPRRTQALAAALGEFGPAEILDEGPSLPLWRSVRDAVPLGVGDGEAVWRASLRPSRGAAFAEAVSRAFPARFLFDWGGGLVWVVGPATEPAHRSVTEAVRSAQGTFWLVRAPPALRAAVPGLPEEPAPLAALTRRVKHAFDPKGILNPGRIFAGV
ncbi:FAD-binding protein [Elioraea thermophila]|uniref:FAD-binding protein n=1 Tax=Elioraea thermophila TaxID=2185104 RepID=UPI000DF48E85|nr:FAD-binding protein [Elioraea thermophila]